MREPPQGDWQTRQTNAGPWFRVSGDDVRLLRDGIEAFPEMLRAIADASHEILLEMYWVGADPVGIAFRDALAKKASQGTVVRVIWDAVGSLGITPSFWEPVARAGGEVREYHPVSPWSPTFRFSTMNRRDHRKILVVDQNVGFTGGLNLARPWLATADGGQGWRDDIIQVKGYAARELRTLFYKTWRRVWLRNLPRDFVPLHVPRDLVPLSKRPTGRVYVVASLRRRRRSVGREYLSRIQGARETIDIANSYFLPDRAVRRALFHAVRRGVRVRVLVPGRSDVTVVQYALEAMYELLLKRGVEIYCYPGPMMHAKTIIIDDQFVMIGSYNLDERSRAKNLEVNVAVLDRPFATHVRGWFDRDLRVALPVDLREWDRRAWVRRGLEHVAYALRRLW